MLSDEECGKLLRAMLVYGEDGVEPLFDTDKMKMAWAFVKPRTDKDERSYNNKVAKSKYAVYCREAKKKGEEPLSFNDWKDYLVMQQCQEE